MWLVVLYICYMPLPSSTEFKWARVWLLTIKNSAVISQWRLIIDFNQVVIISTLPYSAGNVWNVAPAPPVVSSLNRRIDTIRIPTQNISRTFTYKLLNPSWAFHSRQTVFAHSKTMHSLVIKPEFTTYEYATLL